MPSADRCNPLQLAQFVAVWPCVRAPRDPSAAHRAFRTRGDRTASRDEGGNPRHLSFGRAIVFPRAVRAVIPYPPGVVGDDGPWSCHSRAPSRRWPAAGPATERQGCSSGEQGAMVAVFPPPPGPWNRRIRNGRGTGRGRPRTGLTGGCGDYIYGSRRESCWSCSKKGQSVPARGRGAPSGGTANSGKFEEAAGRVAVG
jgi:hypothetical protein